MSHKAAAIAANAAMPFVADSDAHPCLTSNLRAAVGPPKESGVWALEPAREARRLLIRELRFFGPKSASDFLLGLGFADGLLAFDVRLLNLLIDGLGWPPHWRSRVASLHYYEQLEDEVLATLGTPLGFTGLHLDRLLFQHYATLRDRWIRKE